MRKAFVTSSSVIAALVLPLLLGVGPCPRHDPNPIIFVHGGSGSGAQFESQAMRFTSNGYPQSHIAVLEYDSSAIGTILPDVLVALDALIAELKAETGAAQVDLMGHSLGTTVSHTYLATPERAANVAHYVNIDGRPATAPPGGVPTLALWAGAVNRPTPPQIVGATNVTIPNQEHVEVATSEESFFEMYHFLRGRAPFTTHILPEVRPRISGRVTAFPQNSGLDGATLEVWRVNGNTGERIGSQPVLDLRHRSGWKLRALQGLVRPPLRARAGARGRDRARLLLRAVPAEQPPGAAQRGRGPRPLHHGERRARRGDGAPLQGVLG